MGTVVCESQYAGADLELAQGNHHLTVVQAAQVASDAAVGRLGLFHVSDRYTEEELRAMLAEARRIYPPAGFPEEWAIAG